MLIAVACSEEPLGSGGDSGAGAGPDLGAGADAATGDGAVGADVSATDLGPADGGMVDPRDPNNATRDSDCDGLSDAYELATVYPDGQQTSPTNPDSDGDGLTDGLEAGAVAQVPGASCAPAAIDADPGSRTAPTNPDTDGDGIPDGAEDRDQNGRLDAGESDPRRGDTDGDGIPDGVEDADRNGARDAGETDPSRRDTDGDGIADGLEDANRNGTREMGETDPRSTDTDGDTLLDGDEDTNHDGVRQAWESDPRTSDTDCDGISDAEELAGSTSPLAADSDRDGVPDGVELGRTGPVPGSDCPGLPVDTDPNSTTDPTSPDSDGDGIADGDEDLDRDGAVDAGETNPSNGDTDGDGFSDGDEVAAGTDPNNPGDPNGALADALRSICSDANLQPVTFQVGPAWTVAHDPSFVYQALTVAGGQVRAAALDHSGHGIAAFALEMPPIAGQPVTGAGQSTALAARLAAGAAAAGLTLAQRQSPRITTSHDGFESAVSAVFDLGSAARNAADLRNALLAVATGLQPADFGGLPTATGLAAASHVLLVQTLVRPADNVVLVIAGLLDRARFDDAADPRAITLQDLTNGTALARPEARRGKGCDPFQAQDVLIADFIWMADISASTDDDRGRIVSSAQAVFDALANNNVDFRMAVVPHSQSTIHQPSNNGNLRGVGFTRDRTEFTNYLLDVSGTDGCEFGIDSVSAAIRRASPRTAAGADDPRRIRGDAALAVVYVGDENAQEIEEGPCWNIPQQVGCPTQIGDVWTGGEATCSVVPPAAQQACVDQILAPYVQQLRTEGAIAFGQVFNPTPALACNTGHFVCPGSAQDRNEPGRGYVEVINATGGIFYSPCEANPGQGSLQAIVDAVTGAASQFQLRSAPISSTIKVGITRIAGGGAPMTTVVPRDRLNGFDYDPVSNAIFFRGTTYRPSSGDRVTISYRVWQPPLDPCGGPCVAPQVCAPDLGVCSCDLAECATRCGPGMTCSGADCSCTCAPDCGGACQPGQVCNSTSCACECAPDCGGCPAGTQCNPTTCACDCAADCGGACAQGPLSCAADACACVCPADCGGACGSNSVCNPSTCACTCGPACDAACPGAASCDPQQNCACACPADCGGCPDNTVCDAASCACQCPTGCNQQCPNRQVCDPNSNCGCVCPTDCGGCAPNETCDPVNCRCVPIV